MATVPRLWAWETYHRSHGTKVGGTKVDRTQSGGYGRAAIDPEAAGLLPSEVCTSSTRLLTLSGV